MTQVLPFPIPTELPTEALEHPEDILDFVLDHLRSDQKCALIVVTGTLGGSVRRPGAMMAVNEAGEIAGYVSGGCIDNDVALHAQQALQTGESKTLRYGTGSPFMDIQLPCGGGIDVTICPTPDRMILQTAAQFLADRKTVALTIDTAGRLGLHQDPDVRSGFEKDIFYAVCQPRLKLRLAGRGADLIATARLASGAGFTTLVQSPDSHILDAVRGYPGITAQLISPHEVAAEKPDDAFTAFLLMFHDTDLEIPLLRDALEGDAFFIGAVGSRNAQKRRKTGLQEIQVRNAEIARIHGPVGLIPAMRDASMLAISALSHVIAAYHEKYWS
ncbi:MAG: XdhC family protein [Pseudomonadota bacterium]